MLNRKNNQEKHRLTTHIWLRKIDAIM